MRPSLAGSAARNDEAVCANNLRHIGQAFQQWWQEHDEQVAWWMSAPNPAATKSYPYHINIWFQFFWVSNYLSSPRYLVDPADDWPNLRTATSWGAGPGGLLTFPYKATGYSYFLGIHATPLQPQSILSGDGNFRAGGIVGCASGIPSNDVRPQNALWPEGGHGYRGNLLFSDGRVEMTDTARLKEAIAWQLTGFDGNWNSHILKPRQP